MQKYIMHLFLAFLLFSLMVGCSEERVNEDEAESAKIELVNEVNLNTPLCSEGESLDIVFKAKANWSAFVDDGIDWLSLSQSKGTPGTITLRIEAAENNTYDERNAALVLTCGQDKKTVTITQKQKDALILSSNKVEIGVDGGNFSVELKSNVDVSYELDQLAKEWISSVKSRSLEQYVLTFNASENNMPEPRNGKIILKGNNIIEEVNVYQEGLSPSIIITEKEYTVSDKGETIKIEVLSNVDYEVVLPSLSWIKQSDSRSQSSYTHYFEISPNDTYDSRSGEISFLNKESNIEETVIITQVQKDAILIAQNEYTIGEEGGNVSFKINTNVDFNIKTPEWIREIDESRGLVEKILSFNVEPTEYERTGEIEIISTNVTQTIKIFQEATSLYEKHKSALIDLYKSANGDNWFNRTNWCTDKPLSEWYGISVNKDGTVRGIVLYDNNLIGTVPESFSIFFDNCSWIHLSGNTLSGVIPESIRKHPRWSEFAWDFINQRKVYTDTEPVSFDMADINLKITDRDLKLIDMSVINSVDWCKKNKLNMVFTAEKNNLMLPEIEERLINLQLDFQNKGLGSILYYTDCSSPEELDEYDWDGLIYNKLTENLLFSMKSQYSFLCPGNRASAFSRNAYLFDSDGNLLDFVNYDNYIRSGLADSESFFKEIQKKISLYLGEPEEHPEYDSEFYTSTDFSKDGEVTVMQKATVGNGINLVFIGDAFVDLDMNEGGAYEQEIKKGIEELFDIYPYSSYRNRFNIYMVKAVSPNASFEEGAKRAIHSEDDCFKYALKVPGISEKNLGIVIIANPKTIASTSYNVSYSDGSHISFILSGLLRRGVIAHEFSHGFAKLADEYVIEGLENVCITENDKQALDEAWNNWSWGANIDWRNDPETVKWAHLLKDSRFADEGLGIYEGANNFGKGCYRPTVNSIMNDDYNAPYVNAPGREQIYKVIMKLSENENWKYDYESFVEYDVSTRNNVYHDFSRAVKMTKNVNKVVKHRKPIFRTGTWRDYEGRSKSFIVPLR